MKSIFVTIKKNNRCYYLYSLLIIMFANVVPIMGQKVVAKKATVQPAILLPKKPEMCPKPQSWTIDKGGFNLNSQTKLVLIGTDNGVEEIANIYLERVKKVNNLAINVTSEKSLTSKENTIFCQKVTYKVLQKNAYTINISAKNILIKASDNDGFYYAIRTLFQISPATIFSPVPLRQKANWQIPCGTITDIVKKDYQIDENDNDYEGHLKTIFCQVTSANGKNTVKMEQGWKSATIRYTTDGSEPTSQSKTYTTPFDLPKSNNGVTELRFALFQGTEKLSNTQEKSIAINDALGKKYKLLLPTVQKNSNSEIALTNGKLGSNENAQEWVVFKNGDMEMVIDFEKPRTFKQINVNFTERQQQKVFLPEYVLLSASIDGKNWLDINRYDFLPLPKGSANITQTAELPYSEYTSPKRFLKITAKTAQKNTFMWVDEVTVR